MSKTSMCERDSNQLLLAPIPTRDQACNPGMCPDRESNWPPSALQDDVRLSGPC